MKPLLLTSMMAALVSSALGQSLPATLVDNFDGWRHSAHPESWTFADGVLHLKNDPDKQGSTLWTEKQYGDFVLELEFRFGTGRVDSGVFLRQERDQIQIGESGMMKRDMTASPYIGGKGYPVEAEGVAELLETEGWNRLMIVAVGARYDVWLNGRHVMHYESETAKLRGPIGLQLHPGRLMELDYRHIRLAELGERDGLRSRRR